MCREAAGWRRPEKPSRQRRPNGPGASNSDPIDRYLWEVYQRKPIKSDSTGDFTWKARRPQSGWRIAEGLRIKRHEPDFREQLLPRRRAMDASGIRWSMLSAFRDDYRQRLAAGFKAHGGNSQARRQQRDRRLRLGAPSTSRALRRFKCDLALDRRPWGEVRAAPAHAQR